MNNKIMIVSNEKSVNNNISINKAIISSFIAVKYSIKSKFYEFITNADEKGVSLDELSDILNRYKLKRNIKKKYINKCTQTLIIKKI